MTERAPPPATRSVPVDRTWVLALVGALAGFVGAWWLVGLLVREGFYGPVVISDTPVYLDTFDAVLRGALPYRDIAIEYPPLALPAFLLPYLFGVRTGDIDGYSAVFENLMLVAGLATIVFVAFALRGLRASRTHVVLALGLLALSPLLLGPVVLSRYDLWPAALTAAALAAVVAGRHRTGSAVLGLATLAKVYPVVILPILVGYVWRRQGRAEALRCLFVSLATIALVIVPFAILAPDGVADALARQIGRPLQVESLGAALVFVVDALAGTGVVVETSSGSQNLAGSLPEVLATVLPILQLAALVGVWVWFVRGAASRRDFIRAVAASVVAYVAFGKVLSPQYVIWLAPVVVLVGGRRGALACGILVVSLLLTVAYFPARYFDLVDELDRGVAGIVLARDLALVGLFATLVLPLRWLGDAVRVGAGRTRVAARTMTPTRVLILIIVGAVLLRLVWLTLPQGSLIFDEAYYVNAARAILGWSIPADAPYAGAAAGLDPNSEHPPLGKVLIAGSMLVFGDNGLGWRIPSVVAGVAALIALYFIVRMTGRSRWLGVLAVFIFSLDTLGFVHSRIGVLDMMALAAILVGAWLGIARRPVLAGCFFAIGCLIKVTAVFGLVAYLIVEAIPLIQRARRGEALDLSDLRDPVVALGAAALVGIGGLWLLDLRYTTYGNPFEHIGHMLGYGIALTGSPQPSGIASNPWEWLVNGGGFDYLRVDVNSIANGQIVDSHPSVRFQGIMNPVLIGAVWLVVPFAIGMAVRARDRLAQWGLVWIAANYLPYYAFVLVSHRITYFYYVLPTVPALAALTALFLLRAGLPPLVRWVYLGGLVAAFIAYFPFRQPP